MPKKPNSILEKLKPVHDWAKEQVADNECTQCMVFVDDEDDDFVHDDDCIVEQIHELAEAINKILNP